MRKKNKTLIKLNVLSLFLFPLLIASCSDDPASSFDPEDVPQAPGFENIEMDIAIFKSQSSMQIAETKENHSTAAAYAIGAQAALTSMAQLPNMLFLEDAWGDPEYSDGVYSWQYSYAYEGESASFGVTAEELSNGDVDWQLRISVNTAEESVDNALLLRSVVSADGQTGYWELYDIEESGDPEIRLSFEMDNNVPVQILLENGDGIDGSNEILYETEGNITSIIYRNTDGQSQTELVWNNESGEGYLISNEYNNGEKSCWGEDYEDTDCE